jgi:hypothetical protein
VNNIGKINSVDLSKIYQARPNIAAIACLKSSIHTIYPLVICASKKTTPLMLQKPMLPGFIQEGSNAFKKIEQLPCNYKYKFAAHSSI